MAAPTHQFTGAEPDPGIGIYHFGVRTYDPTLRRWLSPDPLLRAAPETDVEVGEDLNLYQYAENNPVGRTDPGGLLGGGRDLATDKNLRERREGQARASVEHTKGFVSGFSMGLVPVVGEIAVTIQADYYKAQPFNGNTAEWRAGVRDGLLAAAAAKAAASAAMAAAAAVDAGVAAGSVVMTRGASLVMVPAAVSAAVAAQVLAADAAATVALALSLGDGGGGRNQRVKKLQPDPSAEGAHSTAKRDRRQARSPPTPNGTLKAIGFSGPT